MNRSRVVLIWWGVFLAIVAGMAIWEGVTEAQRHEKCEGLSDEVLGGEEATPGSGVFIPRIPSLQEECFENLEGRRFQEKISLFRIIVTGLVGTALFTGLYLTFRPSDDPRDDGADEGAA